MACVFYNELYHYGVKGMKWGVRRYQNKDGTLTNEGLKRKQKVKGYDIPKGATLYRAVRNASTGFMNRGYTYVNNTDKYYKHSFHTSEGFESFDNDIKLKTTRKLKIASTDDYVDALIKANGIKIDSYLKDVPDEMIKKGRDVVANYLPGDLTLGDYGTNKIFNKTIEYLKKSGYDGVIDPADGAVQIRDGEEPISTVIFDPKKNVKIEKIITLGY